MAQPTVLITTRSFGREVREPLERLLREGTRVLEWREGSGQPESDLRAKLAEADAWIVAFHPISPALLEAAPRLRIIAKHGVGVDNIDIPAATKRGILVTTAPSANDQAVADLTMALLLALLRRIPEASASVKAGHWERFLGVGLTGKVMGILGLGRIGQNVARRAAGFGVELIGADPQWPEEAAREIGIRRVDLPGLLAESDLISLHAPLTPETRGLIGAREIALMKPGVWIVNTSRGKVVNEQAMREALVSGRIRHRRLRERTADRQSAPGPPKCDRHSPHGHAHAGIYPAHGRPRCAGRALCVSRRAAGVRREPRGV
jgi:phosphoglycerate dehydrogenase-like enzyme